MKFSLLIKEGRRILRLFQLLKTHTKNPEWLNCPLWSRIFVTSSNKSLSLVSHQKNTTEVNCAQNHDFYCSSKNAHNRWSQWVVVISEQWRHHVGTALNFCRSLVYLLYLHLPWVHNLKRCSERCQWSTLCTAVNGTVMWNKVTARISVRNQESTPWCVVNDRRQNQK